jgi:DNA-binding transcriptional LysR family regulator
MRTGVDLHETVSARTLYTATALVRAGVGMTVVDNFTAHAAPVPGLAYRPVQPALAFDIHAIYLQSRPPSQVAASFLKHLARALETL